MGSGLLFHSPLAHPTLPTLVFLFLRSPGVVPSSGPAYWPFSLRGCSSPASSWGFPLPIRWSQARFYFLQEAFPDTDCKVSSPSPSVLLLLYFLHRMHHNLKHVYLACLFVRLFVCLFIYLFIYFRAAPSAYRASQARGQIGTVVPGLHHSHNSNVGSWPCL